MTSGCMGRLGYLTAQHLPGIAVGWSPFARPVPASSGGAAATQRAGAAGRQLWVYEQRQPSPRLILHVEVSD